MDRRQKIKRLARMLRMRAEAKRKGVAASPARRKAALKNAIARKRKSVAGKAPAITGSKKLAVLKKINELKKELRKRKLARAGSTSALSKRRLRKPSARSRILSTNLRSRLRRRRAIEESNSILERADDNINEDTMNKNYGMPAPKPTFVTGPQLKKLKDEQLKDAPPTLLAEDVRESFKRAIKIAYKKFAKNLEAIGHPLKASLWEHFANTGRLNPSVITAAIDSAFEEAGDEFLEILFKRAEEIADYSPETIAEMEREIELTCQVTPTVEPPEEEEEFEEEEKEAEEVEERLVEGSLKIPRSATSKKASLLSMAVPSYNIE